VDVGGKKETFKTVLVDCVSETIEGMRVYPNPARETVNLALDLGKDHGMGTIKLIDHLGNECFRQDLALSRGSSVFTLPIKLQPGTYALVFYSEHLVFPVTKLIIQD
jgi:hypothetical protein